MISLEGLKISQFPFDNLTKEADLIFYEGPLLSYFRNNSGSRYLYYWCDSNESRNRWLFFETHATNLKAYLEKKMTLKMLLENPVGHTIYSLDLDNNGQIASIILTTPEALPKEYSPAEDSYYEFEPIVENETRFSFSIDGNWELSEINDLSRRFIRLNSIVAVSFSFDDTKTLGNIFQKSLRGGYSHANLYGLLESYATEHYPMNLQSIHYASPGQINLVIYPEVKRAITQCFKAMESNRSNIAKAYRLTEGLIRTINKENAGNLRIEHPDDKWNVNAQTLRLKGKLAQDLVTTTKVLAREMSCDEHHRYFDLSGSRFVAFQTVRAIYRNLSAIFKYWDTKQITGYGSLLT